LVAPIAIGIARSIIRAGKKTRFFNAVVLANKLEIEAKLDRQDGRRADARPNGPRCSGTPR